MTAPYDPPVSDEDVLAVEAELEAHARAIAAVEGDPAELDTRPVQLVRLVTATDFVDQEEASV